MKSLSLLAGRRLSKINQYSPKYSTEKFRGILQLLGSAVYADACTRRVSQPHAHQLMSLSVVFSSSSCRLLARNCGQRQYIWS